MEEKETKVKDKLELRQIEFFLIDITVRDFLKKQNKLPVESQPKQAPVSR